VAVVAGAAPTAVEGAEALGELCELTGEVGRLGAREFAFVLLAVVLDFG
jgi:hypothetical protein